MTHEQKNADALYFAYWKRRLGRDFRAEQIPTCEDVRRDLLAHAAYLRSMAEALRNPVTRWKSLLAKSPVDIWTAECDAEDIGKVCKRASKKKDKNRP